MAKKSSKRKYGTVSNDEVESMKEKLAELKNPNLEKEEVSKGLKLAKKKSKMVQED